MKPYSDDELLKNLEKLSQPFQPTAQQKEGMYQEIFQRKTTKPKRQPVHWVPAIVSFILLISVISAVTVLIAKPDSLSFGFFSKDVTESWDQVVLKQEGSNDLTSYYLYFDGKKIGIINNFVGESFMGTDMSDSEIGEASEEFHAKLAKMTLKEGEYQNYTVKKKKDIYTITVPGKNGFSYSLEKTAPRKYLGEDGIRFSTGQYIE